MGILEEMEEEDERFRGVIKNAAYNCEANELPEIMEVLVQESKRRQREIFARHNPNAEKPSLLGS